MITSGQVAVEAAGTAVQVSTDASRRFYWFRADPDNTGAIAIGNDGDDDVTMTNGLILAKTDPPIELECKLSELYVDADNNDDVLCWMLEQ